MKKLKIKKQNTHREITSLAEYREMIEKIAPLTEEAEHDLAQKIQAGDQKALETLYKANLGAVMTIAQLYQHQGLDLTKLITEGNLGLIQAASRYEANPGSRFSEYAEDFIHLCIRKAIAEGAITNS